MRGDRLAQTMTGLLFFLLLAGGSACRQPPEKTNVNQLKADELSLVLSRVPTRPRYVSTKEEVVRLRVFVDPALVEVGRVKDYVLWARRGTDPGWQRVGTAPPEETFAFSATEGLHGLRASVVQRDGSETLVPGVYDEPLVWLSFDYTPPVLRWLEPRPVDLFQRPGATLELRWTAEEKQFGAKPLRLEWSADEGKNWQKIVDVPARQGSSSYRWLLPPEAEGNLLVRVRGWDLAGQEASAEMPLTRHGRIATGLAKAQKDERATEEPPVTTDGGAPVKAIVREGSPGEPAHSGAAEPTEPPAEPDVEARSLPTGSPGAGLPVTPEPLGSDCVAGGTKLPLLWKIAQGDDRARVDLSEAVVLEYSTDGGSLWQSACEAILGDGGVEWQVPPKTEAECRVRLTARRGDATVSAPWPEPFAIDAEAPGVSFGETTLKAGLRPLLPVAITDAGCAGVEAVQAYVRPERSLTWKQLAVDSVQIEDSGLRVDLSGLEETAHDIFLVASDRVGNVSPSPGEVTEPHGRLLLDLSPPHISVEPPVLPWVSGFTASIQVTIEVGDCAPPLVLEGREPDGTWQELRRLKSLTGAVQQLEFQLPQAAREYELRVSLGDSAGNRGEALVGPRDLEGPVRLVSFRSSRTQIAYATEVISWILHDVVSEAAEELRITVEHQAGSDGAWTELCAVKPPARSCDWDLPAADAEEHRLRVRLYRQEELVGEDVSPPFTLVGPDKPLPTVVAISEESLAYHDQGRLTATRFREALRNLETQTERTGDGTPPQASREEVERLAAQAEEKFRTAIEVDPSNYHATYALAQLLNEVDPEKHAEEILRYLELTIKIKPDHHRALNDLGAAYIRAGDYGQAREHLEQALQSQDSPMAHYNLGLAYLYQSMTAEARKHFEQALKGGSDTMHGDMYYYMVYSHIVDGELDKARALYGEKKTQIPVELRAELENRL